MPTPIPTTLSVFSPQQNAKITLHTPFPVTGSISGAASPEPVGVISVTVQVDSVPAVHATFTVDHTNKNKSLIIYNFKTSVTITGGMDPHSVTITAVTDHGTLKQTRNVFAANPFEIDAPAIVLDLLSFTQIDPASDRTVSFIQELQDRLAGFSDTLSTYGRVLIGPNAIAGPVVNGLFGLRLGIWIEDGSFPVIPADSKHGFALPRAPEQTVTGGLALIPFQPAPVPKDVGIGFAVFVPLAAIQKLGAAIFPSAQEQAAAGGAELDSIKITSSTSNLQAEMDGESHSVDYSITFTAAFGIKKVGVGTNADPSRSVPAVTTTTTESSVLDLFNILRVLIFPPFAGVLLAASDILGNHADQLGKSADNSLTQAVQSLPSLIPLSAAQDPVPFPPDFGRCVLNWASFGTSNAGILGTGEADLDERDESMVRILLSGPGEVVNTAANVAGSVQPVYSYTLINIAPDNGALTWSVTGATGNSGGVIDQSQDSFAATLRMPAHPVIGKTYLFALTVSAVETSTQNPAAKLTASVSIPIVVRATKGPPLPQ